MDIERQDQGVTFKTHKSSRSRYRISADELDCWAPSKADLRQDFDGKTPRVGLSISASAASSEACGPCCMPAIVSEAWPSGWIMNCRVALAVLLPIERPRRSVSCQSVPPSAGVTITSMVRLGPVRRARKPLQ